MPDKEPPKHDHTVHEGWLSAIVNDGKDLSEWETNFTEDLVERFASGRKLVSRKQEEILERIYVEKTPN